MDGRNESQKNKVKSMRLVSEDQERLLDSISNSSPLKHLLVPGDTISKPQRSIETESSIQIRRVSSKERLKQATFGLREALDEFTQRVSKYKPAMRSEGVKEEVKQTLVHLNALLKLAEQLETMSNNESVSDNLSSNLQS